MNNIFYHNGNEKVNGLLVGFFNNFSDIKLPDVMDNNLWYTEDSGATIMTFFQPTGIDTENNMSFEHSYSSTRWDDFRSDYPQFENISPFPADPLFLNADAGDFRLLPDSPAINAGLPVSWIHCDFYGKMRDTLKPSIGAIEFPN